MRVGGREWWRCAGVSPPAADLFSCSLLSTSFQFFTGESMDPESTLAYAYYKDGCAREGGGSGGGRWRQRAGAAHRTPSHPTTSNPRAANPTFLFCKYAMNEVKC
jgi:hypothetical protein